MKKASWIVIALIIILISLKISALYSPEAFRTDQTSYHLQQIESVAVTGHLKNTAETYDSKPIVVAPGYYFLQGTMFALFGIHAVKIVDILLFTLILVFIALLAKDILNREETIIFTVLLVATSPITMRDMFTIHPEFFPIAIALALVLVFTRMLTKVTDDLSGSNKKYFNNTQTVLLIATILLLATVPQYGIFFVFSGIAYLLFLLLRDVRMRRISLETITFLTIIITSAYVVIYRKLLSTQGFQSFFTDIPAIFDAQRQIEFGFANAFAFIGVITVLGGTYAIYYYLNNSFPETSKITMYAATACCGLIALILKSGHSEFIFFITVIMLSLCFAGFLSRLIDHCTKYVNMRISKNQYVWILSITIIFVGFFMNQSLALATGYDAAITDETMEMLTWLSTQPQGLTVAPPNIGQSIMHISNKYILISTDWTFVGNTNSIAKDIQTIYSNINTVQVQEAINKYQISNQSYIVYIKNKNIEGISSIEQGPKFTYDTACFQQTFGNPSYDVYTYTCGGFQT